MENRFRLRVWDKKLNTYIKDQKYPIGSDSLLVVKQDGKVYKLTLGDIPDYSDNQYNWAYFDEYENCIIEQCINRKDANGTLIYEGDILKTRNNDLFYNIVVWDDEESGFRLDNYSMYGDFIESIPFDIEYYDLVIVGNVNENPELLTVEV